jgi:hypothetical protein
MKLCVVFDIDETLIHFISPRNYEVWEKTTESNKRALDYKEKETDREVIIFRPFIKDLFTFFMQFRDQISVGIWTYAGPEYAAEIGDTIKKLCGLPDDFFLFIYSVDEIEDHSIAKDLRLIYKNFPEVSNESNTFLIDDLHTNVMHRINKQNSILIEPFAPYGRPEIRRPATQRDHNRSRKDVCFKDLIKICGMLLRETAESEVLFANEKKIRDMGLESYYHRKKRIMHISHKLNMNTVKSKTRTKSKSKSKTLRQR